MELDYARLGTKGFPRPLSPVYLFTGSDDALKREAVLRLTEPLLDPSFADFDREERDVPSSGGIGDGETARQILASAGGAPMASERRVVLVTNIQRLGKEDEELLAAGLPKLGGLSCLVLIAGAREYEAGKAKGPAVGTKLANALGKAGTVVLCDAPADSGLQARANALLKERGKTMEAKALSLVLDRARSVATERGGGGKTGDLQMLLSELEKVLAYGGERQNVTVADVAAVGIHNVEDSIFRLLDCVGNRNAKQALVETDHLLLNGGKSDGVAARTFVMLARHLRLVWGAKFLAEHRLNGFNLKSGMPPEVEAVLSGEMLGLTQRQSFLLKNLQEQARVWSYDDLGAGLARVLTSDLAMKGIAPEKTLGPPAPGGDPASNLRLLVVALCRTDFAASGIRQARTP